MHGHLNVELNWTELLNMRYNFIFKQIYYTQIPVP